MNFKSQISFVLIFSALFVSLHIKAQDPFFSYTSEEDTYFNPANSFNALLSTTKANFDLQFRDQWSSITSNNTYATIRLQGDYNIYQSNEDSWNGGLLFLSDNTNEGFYKQTSVRFIMSYTRRLTGRSFTNTNAHFISGGFSYGFTQTNIDFNSLWFGRQFDTNLLIIDPSISSGENLNTDSNKFNDLAFGLKWMFLPSDESLYSASLGFDHINKPSNSNNSSAITLSTRINLQLYAKMPIDDLLSHEAKITLISQEPFYQIVPSYQLSVGIDNLENDLAVGVGIGSRLVNAANGLGMDAVIFNVGLSADNWNMNFSFDLTMSNLNTYVNGNGAIELTLGYRILND
ncbi:MAG: hypothetical protein HKN51_09730 [Saprospiraceae bacterium]|nr:hypothetical protein [Bacteroidia bacterium]NNE15244.1 hypothetical protein [Saprospiraceae bacterium]